MNNLHMSEILSSKYDVHLDYQITMYDQLPYKRNADLCGEQNIAMYSGHIIKYYMCDNKEDSFEVDNHDGEIKTLLADIEANTSVTPTVEDISVKEFESFDDVPDNEPNPSIPTVDAFAGIEDW